MKTSRFMSIFTTGWNLWMSASAHQLIRPIYDLTMIRRQNPTARRIFNLGPSKSFVSLLTLYRNPSHLSNSARVFIQTLEILRLVNWGLPEIIDSSSIETLKRLP